MKPIRPEAVSAARTALPDDAILALVVETFEALADSTRVRLLYALADRELCARDLAILTEVSESAASNQLRHLNDRRLVKARSDGRTIYYSLETHYVAALFAEAEYHADHIRSGLPGERP